MHTEIYFTEFSEESNSRGARVTVIILRSQSTCVSIFEMSTFAPRLFKNAAFPLFLAIALMGIMAPIIVHAQDVPDIYSAKVIEVISQTRTVVAGTEVDAIEQVVIIELLNGPDKGKTEAITNDYVLLSNGDKIFVSPQENGGDSYSVVERDRTTPLLILLGIFAIAALVFGRMQGLRALLSLCGSFFIIIYVLLPSLLKGYPPLLVSTMVATVILFLAIYITHGFNRQSTVAFLGTVSSVFLTSVLAFFSVALLRLTGFGSEEAVMLNLHSAINIDFNGLLLGGIIIGALGVLDDIAVTQAAMIDEFYGSSPNLTKKEAYFKAFRVGKEHVSALINTLVLAYAGASLPLLMMFATSGYPFAVIVSQEMVSAEIVRALVGSIGLILTVPITTLLAVYILKGDSTRVSRHVH